MLSAFMSHQYGLGSYLGVNAICELSLLLVLSLAPRGFSLATPVFPTPLKPTLENSHSTRNGRPKTILWMCYLKMLGTSNFFSRHSPTLRFNYSTCYISIYYNVRSFKQAL